MPGLKECATTPGIIKIIFQKNIVKNLSEDEKNTKLQELVLKNPSGSGPPLSIEDLGLNFQFCPSSRIYGFTAVDLKPSGEDEMITMNNAEEYVDLMFDFCMHTGIQQQMEAFRGNIKGPRIPFPFDIRINTAGYH